MSSVAASRTTFLDKASLLLATASPAVSAELRSSLNDDPACNNVASHNHVCTCKSCGTVLILGWNGSILRSNAGPRSRQDRLANKNTLKSMKVQCSQCNSITTLESTKPARETVRKVTRDKPTTSTESRALVEDEQRRSTMPKPTIPASTENPATRKRSRNNKKSSLQSLLADHKSSKQKTSNLDIMDFMKT